MDEPATSDVTPVFSAQQQEWLEHFLSTRLPIPPTTPTPGTSSTLAPTTTTPGNTGES